MIVVAFVLVFSVPHIAISAQGVPFVATFGFFSAESDVVQQCVSHQRLWSGALLLRSLFMRRQHPLGDTPLPLQLPAMLLPPVQHAATVKFALTMSVTGVDLSGAGVPEVPRRQVRSVAVWRTCQLRRASDACARHELEQGWTLTDLREFTRRRCVSVQVQIRSADLPACVCVFL